MPRPPLRCVARPSPEDWADDEPMTLAEAIAVFYPNGPVTASSLRTEYHKHRLPLAEVAGRFYVTPANLKALFEPRILPCPESQKDLASTFAPPGATVGPGRSTSSAMAERKSALASARTSLRALKKPSGNTSGRSVDRRNSTATPAIPTAS